MCAIPKQSFYQSRSGLGRLVTIQRKIGPSPHCRPRNARRGMLSTLACGQEGGCCTARNVRFVSKADMRSAHADVRFVPKADMVVTATIPRGLAPWSQLRTAA